MVLNMSWYLHTCLVVTETPALVQKQPEVGQVRELGLVG